MATIQWGVRCLPPIGTQLGQSIGHIAQLRTDRARGDAAVPGPRQGTLDAARRAQGLREGLAAAQSQAVEDARTRYQAELTKRSEVGV